MCAHLLTYHLCYRGSSLWVVHGLGWSFGSYLSLGAFIGAHSSLYLSLSMPYPRYCLDEDPGGSTHPQPEIHAVPQCFPWRLSRHLTQRHLCASALYIAKTDHRLGEESM